VSEKVVEVEGLIKRYDDMIAVNDISFDVCFQEAMIRVWHFTGEKLSNFLFFALIKIYD